MNASATAQKVELLAPGARLGRYHLLRRLAIGGMAELHIACAEGLAGFQKVVVLKRVLPNLAQDDDFEVGYRTFQAGSVAEGYDVYWDAVALATFRIGCGD